MRWWEIILLCLAGGIIAFAFYFLTSGLLFGWQESLLHAIGCGTGTFLGCLISQVAVAAFKAIKKKK